MIISNFDGPFRFLSNFWLSHMTINDKLYISNEHFYQASKACNEVDHEYVRLMTTPGNAKRAGSRIKLRSDWEALKIPIMRQGLIEKFKDPGLRVQLNNLKGKLLIEGNVWHDNFWGDCSCSKCKNIYGENNLGKLIMGVRDLHENGRFINYRD